MVAINIVNFELLPTKSCHSVFHLREDSEREVVLTEALEIHFIEMPKYKAMEKKDTGDEFLRWLIWLDKDSPRELVEEIAKMDKGIELAEKRVTYITQDKEEMRAYFRREAALSDMATMEYHARRAGRAEGREEGIVEGEERGMRKGREEGIVDVALKALAEGASVEFVSKITGLEVEAIRGL